MDILFENSSYYACKELCAQLSFCFDLSFLRPETEYLFTFYQTTDTNVLEVARDWRLDAPDTSATYRGGGTEERGRVAGETR